MFYTANVGKCSANARIYRYNAARCGPLVRNLTKNTEISLKSTRFVEFQAFYSATALQEVGFTGHMQVKAGPSTYFLTKISDFDGFLGISHCKVGI